MSVTMEFSLIIDAIIAILLVATIAYAAVLNRKLGVLRDGKAEMEALIASFSESTERAGSGVESLKREAGRSGEALQNRMEAARGLVDDLGFLIETGTKLAERLDGGIGAARARPAAGLAAGRAQAPKFQAARPTVAATKAPAAVRSDSVPGNVAGDKAGDKAVDMAGGSASGPVPDGDPAPDAAATDLSAAESELLKALQGMR